MKEIFEETVHNANEIGIERSATGWERKIGRLKSAVSKHMSKRSSSEACGGSALHAKPPFVGNLYNLERYNACHSPLAVIDSRNDGTELEEESKQQLSSWRWAQTAHSLVIEEYVEDQKERFGETLEVMEEGKKTRQRLADALIAILVRQ